MTTIRSQLITAVVTALDAPGKPAGLSVVRRRSAPIEETDLPKCMVSRVRETVSNPHPGNIRTPIRERHLTVRLDLWAAGDDAEDALEPMLAWATMVMLSAPGWGGLAIDTVEDSTEWDTDLADQGLGHAWMDFTIRFKTKTTDQEST